MKYKANILHVNYWKLDESGSEIKREFACRPDEKEELVCKLERAMQENRIVDYEIYGFANFQNLKSGINFGDVVYEREAKRQLKLI